MRPAADTAVNSRYDSFPISFARIPSACCSLSAIPTSANHEPITAAVAKTSYGCARMITVPRINPADSSDSAYAAELRRISQNSRFAPKLEKEYVREHLIRSRTLIRVACAFAVVFGISRAIARIVSSVPNAFVMISLALAISSSLILAAIAWSRAFERVYLRWAEIIVPTRNSIVAITIAMVASQGQLEVLVILPLILMGPFFFLGLQFRAALLSAVVTALSFIVSAAAFELTLPVSLQSGALVVLALVASAIAARDLERRSRIYFLETRVIAELAEHDALTGMKNRRILDEHLLRLWRQAVEDDSTIAVLLIDVDHFKAYNDRYGHQAGDQALRRVAQHIQTFVRRPLDIVARYGGEEFAALLYDVDEGEAAKVADRIRHAVETLNIEHASSPTSKAVTVSIGLAVVRPMAERNPHGALQLADQALYDAKLQGRNKVEVLGERDYEMLQTGSFVQASAAG